MVPWKKTMTNEKNNPDQDARGVEGLTEVLRLQAEALSRISERMSGARGASQESGPAKAPAPAQAQPAEPQGGGASPCAIPGSRPESGLASRPQLLQEIPG